MNQFFSLRTFSLLFALIPLLSSHMTATTGGINQTDERGQRQGYWIIKGSMIDDREYKPEAKVEEGNYQDNRKEGLWKRYWPDGNLRSEITYISGRPEGEYTLFYANGKVEEHSNWNNNRNTGEFRRYYNNGQPHQEFVFADNGKRNGPQKYYHDNGKIAMEVNMVNGAENGIMKRYNRDGGLAEERLFENGTMKPNATKTYAEVSAPIVPVKDPYDSSVGKESRATEDKTNKAQAFKPNGFNTLYDKNGAVTQVGEFMNGRLYDGKWYRFNSDGILVRIEIYKGGKFVGSGVIGENEH